MNYTSFHSYIISRKIIWIFRDTLFYVYEISDESYKLVSFDHFGGSGVSIFLFFSFFNAKRYKRTPVVQDKSLNFLNEKKKKQLQITNFFSTQNELKQISWFSKQKKKRKKKLLQIRNFFSTRNELRQIYRFSKQKEKRERNDCKLEIFFQREMNWDKSLNFLNKKRKRDNCRSQIFFNAE